MSENDFKESFPVNTPQIKTMLQEQINKAKDALQLKENDDQRKSIFRAYLEDPERGAYMFMAFASYNDFHLEASPEEIVNQMNQWLDCIDSEISLEILKDVAGGKIQPKSISNEAIRTRDGFMHGDDRFMHGDDRY